MPMIHVPEIDAENPYQKTGTINRYESRACPIRYQKLIPEKFGAILHVRRVRNRNRFSGTGFWCRFLISVSWPLNLLSAFEPSLLSLSSFSNLFGQLNTDLQIQPMKFCTSAKQVTLFFVLILRSIIVMLLFSVLQIHIYSPNAKF